MSRRQRSWSRTVTWMLVGASGVSGVACSRPARTESDSGLDASAPAATAARAIPPEVFRELVFERGEGQTPLLFEAPIAGATRDGSIFVGGVDRRTNAVSVARVRGRTTRWLSPVLADVRATPDAELRVHALGDDAGLVVVFRGARAGKKVRQGVFVTADGVVAGAPFAVGNPYCFLTDALAWMEPIGSGYVRLRVRRGGDGGPRDELVGRFSEDALLTCGSRRAFVYDPTEAARSYVVASRAPQGARRGPPLSIAKGALGGGEAREHLLYAMDDTPVVVRIAEDGAVGVAVGGDKPLFRQVVGARVGEGAAIVAGAPHANGIDLLRVRTPDACTDGQSRDLTLVLVSWHDTTPEEVTLPPSPCPSARAPGQSPWLARVRDGTMAAWPAPVGAGESRGSLALEHLLVRAGSAGSPTRVDVGAETLVDAGCEGSTCTALALVDDGGTPGGPRPMRLVRFP